MTSPVSRPRPVATGSISSVRSAQSVSVALPAYRRPHELEVCLAALIRQSRAPIEVLVGYRSNDTETVAVLTDWASRSGGVVRGVEVGSEDNLAASLNAAIDATTGDLVALTDDDAEPPADWLDRLAGGFADPSIGGVGGKDIQQAHPGEAHDVGRVQWFGRVIGNHHLATGPARDVDVLKGVNCCFRGDLLRSIRIDERLRGRGNVTHWELAICSEVRRAGLRLVLDPSIAVVHHVAPRHDGDVNNRGGFNAEAHADATHNETLILLERPGFLNRLAFLVWSLTAGTSACPGLAQMARPAFWRSQGLNGVTRWWRTLSGRLAAVRTTLTDRGVTPRS